MSDSARPHRWQPTRLPRPWGSPGKNSGVGCHFLLQYMKVKSESEVAQSCPTLRDPMQPTSLLCPWDFPGKSTGVGCHCLMNNKSKTGLFKHKALKKGLLFSKNCSSLLSMTIQLGNQMKKKTMNPRFFYILLNRVPDTQE